VGQDTSESDKRQALEKVLASRVFEKSGRARDLLSYIIDQEIHGNAEAIKGFSIAVDVFGKDETFDAVSDPLVRVQAGRLRDYLRDYYASEGVDDPLIISVPRGGYRPQYRKRHLQVSETTAAHLGGLPDRGSMEAAQAIEAPPAHEAAGRVAPPTTAPNHRLARTFRRIWFAIFLLFVLIALMIIAYLTGFLSPDQNSQSGRDSGLPRIQVITVGNAPEVMLSAQQLSVILGRFDTIAAQTETVSAEALEGRLDWGGLEYALRVSEQAQSRADGPKNIRYDLVHPASGIVLRSETYLADIWTSPELALVAASKMSGVALPGRLVYAEILSRNAETPPIRCMRLIRTYYEQRNAANHEAAYQCTNELNERSILGGLMRSSHAGLWAEGIGKEYDHVEMTGGRQKAMRDAVRLAHDGVDLAPASARAARELGFVHSWRREIGQMQQWFARAYELNPYDTSVAASYGYGLVLSGDYRKVVNVLGAAVSASTRHPTWWDFYYSVALLMENRVGEAKSAAEPLAASGRNLFYSILNAALALESGNRRQSAMMVREITERFPKFVDNPELKFSRRYLPDDLAQRLISDLRQSGL
jgi:hypothetical protein